MPTNEYTIGNYVTRAFEELQARLDKTREQAVLLKANEKSDREIVGTFIYLTCLDERLLEAMCRLGIPTRPDGGSKTTTMTSFKWDIVVPVPGDPNAD